ESISVYNRIMAYFSIDYMAVFTTFDLTPLLTTSGFLSIATIIPLAGYYYCKAGIKSMRYDKAKKQYYYTETKIGLMIFGFVLVCVAVALLLTILLQILTPYFQFLADLFPTGIPPAEIASIIPQLLIPTVLTLLIIFFVYWIGSKIMKTSVKKEELFK
ncbi:MAG: hypothetical protein ACTSQQ_16295, partial [Candidatus Helarchaeota archaeon]